MSMVRGAADVRLLARDTPFSYACGGCGSCCVGKRITLTPYEIARLAHATHASTTSVLLDSTEEGGTVLRQQPNGACIFFRARQCTVHEGRPLACRLYPLGRRVDGEGNESFAEVSPHPTSLGVYGSEGTVDSWLEAQGAPPFLASAARYHALFKRMFAVLKARQEGLAAFQEVLDTSTEMASDWLDVDATVSRVCGERGEPVPASVEARVDLHLAALSQWLDTLEPHAASV
jgi:hypothetical protein